ncbi:MAG: PaaI family thioesterase [Xanthobacteraceae bacterium]
MNDRPQAADATAFDPAAQGWEEIVNHTAFGDLVGPIWRREQNGQPRFGFVVAPKHLNRAGNLHGGMLMTVADQSMAMTARQATGGKPHATIELNIQFVGGVKLGEFVESHPEVVRVTRSVVFMQAKMFVGKRMVVTTNGIWKILDEA